MNLIKDWYTDALTIYRVESYLEGSLTKQRRVATSFNVPCRIAKRSNRQIKMTDTTAETVSTDVLVCANTVDIMAGDELEIIRGGMLGYSHHKVRYFAGDPDALYTPFGGVMPDIDHQEVPMFAQNRVKKG